jgi:hypothetical protein
MPKGDGTGPVGMGPMTGMGAGFCAGFAVPGYMNRMPGCGMGIGKGRGFRRMFYLTGMPGCARYGYPAYGSVNMPVADEKEILSNQAEFLESQLKQVKKRLQKLNDETE